VERHPASTSMSYGSRVFKFRGWRVALFLAVLVVSLVNGSAGGLIMRNVVGTNMYNVTYQSDCGWNSATVPLYSGQTRYSTSAVPTAPYPGCAVWVQYQCTFGGAYQVTAAQSKGDSNATLIFDVGLQCSFPVACQVYWVVQNTDSVPRCYGVYLSGTLIAGSRTCIPAGGTATWLYTDVPCSLTNSYLLMREDVGVLPDGTGYTNLNSVGNLDYASATNVASTNWISTNWSGSDVWYATA